MNKIEIDKNTWHRDWQYNIFSPRSYPYLGITSPINIDYLVKFAKETHISFYALMSYIVMKTIQEIDEFKYVLDKDKIYKYEEINMTCTVLNNEKQLRFSPLIIYDEDLTVFLERFLKAKKLAEENINVNTELENNLVYITCTPWMRVTSLTHPMDEENKDSIPRISWGKYFSTPEGYQIDLSIQVNHAFQDGYHLGLFYEGIQKNIENLKQFQNFDALIELVTKTIPNINEEVKLRKSF